MRPLAELGSTEARGLAGLVFDLDDTLLDGGRLGEQAYASLFRMRESGLRLVASTGRPAGWAEVIQRQWPIDLTIAENGAVALYLGDGDRVRAIEDVRASDREELERVAADLVARFPSAALADDNRARWTDVTIDIGEHRRVPAEDVAAMRAIARSLGLRTAQSSVHLHLTRSGDDKASGTLRALGARFGDDATTARARYAFAGDSANDGPAFAAFAVTFGVANVREHVRNLTVPPRYVAEAPRGAGFAEIALRLVSLRSFPDAYRRNG